MARATVWPLVEGHRQVPRAVVLHLFQRGQRNHRQQERALGIVPKISRYDTGRGTRNGPHMPTLGSTGTSWMDACIPHHTVCGMIAGPAGRPARSRVKARARQHGVRSLEARGTSGSEVLIILANRLWQPAVYGIDQGLDPGPVGVCRRPIKVGVPHRAVEESRAFLGAFPFASRSSHRAPL